MTEKYSQLYQAIEAWAIQDLSTRLGNGGSSTLRRIVARQKAEYDAYLSGEVEEKDFSSYQKHLACQMADAKKWAAVLEALLADESDSVAEDAAALFGSLLGRIGYLEGRIAALEAAIDE